MGLQSLADDHSDIRHRRASTTIQSSEPSAALMTNEFGKISFTPFVKSVQTEYGSRDAYEKANERDWHNNELSSGERGFIEGRDSFYMASVSETGWPYVQHRGGPLGFVKVLDNRTLGFADFRGNRQYISVGNLMIDDRVALIFMDYPNRQRLKVLGHTEVVGEVRRELLASLAVPGYKARVERGLLVHVAAFDWNCPQHITPRYTNEEIVPLVRPLRNRIDALEQELARYRQPPHAEKES
jgi:predicted pyridoxine 5'-phosphate oxidase superfamily flavin-nucleotide-binding protein